MEASRLSANSGDDDENGAPLSERIARDCEQLAVHAVRLGGPGAAAVRAAARQLVVAVEQYEQLRRRLAAEQPRDGARPSSVAHAAAGISAEGGA
jgi:hypothetical protein